MGFAMSNAEELSMHRRHTIAERYELAAQEDRCSPRTQLLIPAQLRASGGRAFQTMVHDLSISGFSSSCVNRMHVGQICWLTLPNMSALQAEVIWWEESFAGCAFHDLLSPIVHENIIARHRNSVLG